MLENFQAAITNQYEAAFCTLGRCVDRCPAAAWNAPVVNLQFCQVAFHTLIYADLYLGSDAASLRQQSFHLEKSPAFFGSYEELEDRPPQEVYEKSSISIYLDHCREKARRTVGGETEASLHAPSPFSRQKFSRAESHLNNIRHIFHHSAQMSMRLRLDYRIDIPWAFSGWDD